MKCDENCFECEYEDCIVTEKNHVSKEQHRMYQAKYRAQNKERFRENQTRWRNAHKDEINRKHRERNLLSKRCGYCGASLKGMSEVLKRGRCYFCTKRCLCEYLLQTSVEKGEVKTIIMPHTDKGR